MMQITSFVLGFGLSLFMLVACGGKVTSERQQNRTDRIDNVQVSLQKDASDFVFGDTLFFTLALRNKEMQPDSVQVFLNKHFQYTLLTPVDTLCALTPQRVGSNTVRIRSFYPSATEEDVLIAYYVSDMIPTYYQYTLVARHPHDPQAFTQGLFYHEGYLYESTGQWGQSSLRKVAIETGEVLRKINLDNQYFGEGIALFDGKIIQLTYRAGKAFVYDFDSFEKLHTFHYPNAEGWGITTYADQLIMTDGSNKLYFWSQQDFSQTDVVEVYDNKGPVHRINELAYINGKIFANVFLEDYVVVIDPQSGRVEAKIDFSTLLQAQDRHPEIDVLNGIAFNDESGNLYITGKNWPVLFEITLKHQDDKAQKTFR